MAKYDKIINMKRPEDPKHPPMSMASRAAQFAPFDALSGFNGRIYESGRLTEERIELCAERKLELSDCLRFIIEHIGERPRLKIRFFVPDKTKDGGAYLCESSKARKIDEYDERLYLENGRSIAFDDISDIELLQ